MPDRRDTGWMRELERRYRAKAARVSLLVGILQAVLLAAFLVLWEAAVRYGWLDELLFSHPTKIARTLADLAASGTLLPHVMTTVIETTAGFVLGTLGGTLLAALLWWFPVAARVLDPYLVVLNSLPKVALGPIFIVGFGPGYLAIIMTAVAVTIIITTLTIYGRFREIDANYLKVVRLFGGTRWQVFRLAVLPASLPTIVSALKVNVGLSWVGVIVGEFLTAKRGLGYLIIYGFQVFNFTLVLSSLIVIGVVAALMYGLVSLVEARMSPGYRVR
ncbi:ABC transporter permease [Thermobacillus sp. ZCTH02-B1]|uniref:ABC transporter permease n=1 Tax=Thermobacillus sp. ZCTH02-B1 TaxID=1858795 RepID=UPI0025FECC4B|nr:ABC transporter permease [Thermobacillus sp. ZCTH02-B1]